MSETKTVYRVILNKTTIIHDNGVAQSGGAVSEQIYSQDIEGNFDVRGLIAAVNGLNKPEEKQPVVSKTPQP